MAQTANDYHGQFIHLYVYEPKEKKLLDELNKHSLLCSVSKQITADFSAVVFIN